MSDIPKIVLDSLNPTQIRVINRISENVDTFLGAEKATIVDIAEGFYEAHRIMYDLLELEASPHALNYAMANLMAYQVMLLEFYIKNHPNMIVSAVETSPHIAEFLVNEVEKLRAAKLMQ